MMRKKSAKQVVRTSKRASARVVANTGGRLTAASGAWLEKGDARIEGIFRIETKCPPTLSHRITVAEWKKIETAALRDHEDPVFHLRLGPHDIIFVPERAYIAYGGRDKMSKNLYGQKGYRITIPMWEDVLLSNAHLLVEFETHPNVEVRGISILEFQSLVETATRHLGKA